MLCVNRVHCCRQIRRLCFGSVTATVLIVLAFPSRFSHQDSTNCSLSSNSLQREGALSGRIRWSQCLCFYQGQEGIGRAFLNQKTSLDSVR